MKYKKDECLQKYKALEQENENLQKEVQKLKPLINKLTLHSNKLELILRNQKGTYDKAGIGFNSTYKYRFQQINFQPLLPLKNQMLCIITIKKQDTKLMNAI